MKDPSDAFQLHCLTRQAFSVKAKLAMDAFNNATRRAYGYLICVLSPLIEEAYRLQSKVFPEEDTIVYQSIETLKHPSISRER